MCQTTHGTCPTPPSERATKASPQTEHRVNLLFEVLQWDDLERRRLQDTITDIRRRAFENEYGALLDQAGVRIRIIRLSRQTLAKLAGRSFQDAERVVLTYNKDLRRFLTNAIESNPAADQFAIRRMADAWHESRAHWKNPQIALYAEMDGIQMAQEEFFRLNAHALKIEYAEASPTTAVCEVCQRRVALGKTTESIARANPFPAHVNCVHMWVYKFSRIPGARIQGEFLFSGLLGR